MNRLIYQRFGSRSGFLRFLGYTLLARLGFYRRYSRLPDTGWKRLVFVCSGNICRSPLAEAYARSLGWEAASCGLHCREGFPADPRAIAFASDHGFDLSGHRTLNVQSFNFRDTDVVVVMEPSQISEIKKTVGALANVMLAGQFCTPSHAYLHDPFNCSDSYFHYCETRVVEAVRRMCA